MRIPVDEIIQVEIASLKRLLRLDTDIVIITDAKRWEEMFPLVGRMKDAAGEARVEIGYIFVNLENNKQYKELKDTLAHEMLHIKYPKASEKQIQRLTRNYIN